MSPKNSSQRVCENGHRLFKRDGVLQFICFGLLRVPVELESHVGGCYHAPLSLRWA